jgi:hypothetical protein
MPQDTVENDGWARTLPSQDRQQPSNVIVTTSERDEHGRFLTGNSGGGRRKGSRNKPTERFLDTIASDFAEHGAEAIARVRIDDPATYLKIVGSLIPRELILQRERGPAINISDVTD